MVGSWWGHVKEYDKARAWIRKAYQAAVGSEEARGKVTMEILEWLAAYLYERGRIALAFVQGLAWAALLELGAAAAAAPGEHDMGVIVMKPLCGGLLVSRPGAP